MTGVTWRKQPFHFNSRSVKQIAYITFVVCVQRLSAPPPRPQIKIFFSRFIHGVHL